MAKWYPVSIATSAGRKPNRIQAKDKAEATRKVKVYNQRHPSWNMRLLKRKPYN